MPEGRIDVVMGLRFGDEGKGRISDLLGHLYDIIARYNGGPNAGHQIMRGADKLALHQIPSGILNPDALCMIGGGALVDLVALSGELDDVQSFSGLEITPERLMLGAYAHLILPHHRLRDELRESGLDAQGSTKKGIAYAAGAKYERDNRQLKAMTDPEALRNFAASKMSAWQVAKVNWVRFKRNLSLPADQQLPPFDPLKELDLLEAAVRRFKPYVGDTFTTLHERLADGVNVLAEGAQAAGLDIESPSYPDSSSSHPGPAGAMAGLRFGPQYIGEVYGVMKAIETRVGHGEFVTEEHREELVEIMRGKRGEPDAEFGASTGRPRRVGYPNMVETNEAIKAHGVTQVVLNKVDVMPKLGDNIMVVTHYDNCGRDSRPRPVYKRFEPWTEDISHVRDFAELPSQAQTYIKEVASMIRHGARLTMVGVGPEADQMIRLAV